MTGLQSLIKKSTPSSFAYISEKLGNALFDKVLFEKETYTTLAEYVMKRISDLVVFVSDG